MNLSGVKRLRLLLLTSLLVLTSSASVPIAPVGAQPPSGTILVADPTAGTSGKGALFSINPSTGARTLISDFGNAIQGPLGAMPNDLAIDALGNLIVVDADAGTTAKGAVFSVNAATGTRIIISDFGSAAQGPTGLDPNAVNIDASGNIIVVDRDAGTSGKGAIFSVNPATGARTLISDFGNSAQGPVGLAPTDVAIDPSANFIVTSGGAGTGGQGAIFSVIPSTGARTIISDFGNGAQGPLGVGLSSVVIDSLGNYIVTDPHAGTSGKGALFSVNPSTSLRTIISDFGNSAQGALGASPTGLDIDASGNIIVIDPGAGTGGNGAVFVVNPTTGVRTIISDFGNGAQGPGGHRYTITPMSLRIVGRTRAGSNIFVGFPQFSPSGLRLTYGTVTTKGISSVTSAAASSCLKGNVAVLVGTCFQFAFSGTFTGGAMITLPYTPGAVPSGRSEGDIRLFHIKSDGTVEDLTTSVDTTNKRVTGTASNFQFFVAGLPSTTTTTATTSTTTATSATTSFATTSATTSITTIVTSVTSTVTGVTTSLSTSLSTITSTITTIFTTGAPIPGSPPDSIVAGLIFGVIALFGLRWLRRNK